MKVSVKHRLQEPNKSTFRSATNNATTIWVSPYKPAMGLLVPYQIVCPVSLPSVNSCVIQIQTRFTWAQPSRAARSVNFSFSLSPTRWCVIDIAAAGGGNGLTSCLWLLITTPQAKPYAVYPTQFSFKGLCWRQKERRLIDSVRLWQRCHNRRRRRRRHRPHIHIVVVIMM